MKKLFLTILFFIIFTPLVIKAELCEDNKISIESITCIDKSENIRDCNQANVIDNNIELNLEVYEVGDTASYEIVIKNDSDEDYELNKDDLNLSSDYINYTLKTDDEEAVLGANKTTTVLLDVEYANEVPSDLFENGQLNDSKVLKVNIFSMSSLEDVAPNPETLTGALITIGFIILLISAVLLILLKNKKYKEFLALSIAAFLIIPITIYAVCSYSVDLDTNITINNQPTIKEYLIENYPNNFTKYDRLVTDEVGKTVQATNVFFAKSQETNNAIFAGYCWQIVRTTEQGGIKMIFNGNPVNGACPDSYNIEDRIIGKSVYNTNNDSFAYVGYMYNKAYPAVYLSSSSLNVFGKSVKYENGKYTLQDTSNTRDEYHHYGCNTREEGDTCETVNYFFNSYSGGYVIKLTDGKTVEDAIDEMLYAEDVNKYDSTIKTYIENWYEEHMTSYTYLLDDNVYCNDRSTQNAEENGWNPNGGDYNTYYRFRNYAYTGNDLDCPNITDQFSTANEKAPLKYPIALITEPERQNADPNLLNAHGTWYWAMSPVYYRYDNVPFVSYVMGTYFYPGSMYYGDNVNSGYYSNINVRPVIALRKYVAILDGDGSRTNPFTFEEPKD